MMNDGESTLNRSIISVAKTGLVQLWDVKTKSHFMVALINGLGQQLKAEFRQAFAERVRKHPVYNI